MAEHSDLGKLGEEEAVAYLKKNGYRIIDRNWHFSKAEIDVIAEKDDCLIMVEVKTRTNDMFGKPQEFVSRTKQKHLIKAANRYVELHPTEREIRFDVIAILIEPHFSLEHIPEAFYP